jgi:PKD repeat protein
MNRASILRVAVAASMLALSTACTMKSEEAPPYTGPSELDKSISVAVSPDVLTQDGASQSLVTVTALDGSNSQPLRNLTLRAETRVDGMRVDFGSLSARSVVTGADGRATFVYTAPAAPAVATDDFLVVEIVVTPTGTDFNNSAVRRASIRLVPPGLIIPPDGLRAAFTVNPTGPTENQTVLFDASGSQGAIVEYQWDFGDGARGSGRTVQHAYRTAGTYVARLVIVDGFGRSASAVQSITVGAGVQPTAAFVFSPTNPLPAQQVFFNASASRPAPGRSISSYQWDFGDGASGSGAQPSHAYAAPGQYNVTLVITDDVGRTASITQGVTVGSDSPTADFTFAPTSPSVNVTIAFNGSTSTAVAGRTIVSYTWNFGDGTSGSGVAVSKSYPTVGTRNVTLTVVDNQGKSGSVTKPVTVVP